MDGPQRWRILRLHVEDGISLTTLARDTGTGLRTLQRWHQRTTLYGHLNTEHGRARTLVDGPAED